MSKTTHSLFTIEGNLGAGKSTLVKILKSHLGYHPKYTFLQEPVQEWIETTDSDGSNILELFYKNKARWSYSFQMNAFITKQKLLEQIHLTSTSNPQIILSERSAETDRECFSKLLHQEGNISELEWKLYDNWYTWLMNKMPIKTNGIIYLRCTPETSIQRIHKRNRLGENNISFDYLDKLFQQHEKWLGNTKIPVLTINVDTSFENDEALQKHIFSKILNFIQINQNSNLLNHSIKPELTQTGIQF